MGCWAGVTSCQAQVEERGRREEERQQLLGHDVHHHDGALRKAEADVRALLSINAEVD